MPRSCLVCGSRKWRKDAVTGSAICEDGHVFQDFRSENLVTEATNYAMQKRTLKRAPRKNRRKEAGNVNQEYYHGTDAEFLKIQAMQLLLRCQVEAMRRLWSLPDTYEMIVRDLWAYQLAVSPLPSIPEPFVALSPERFPLPPFTSADHGVIQSQDQKDDEDEASKSSGSSKSEGDAGIDPEVLAELSEDSTDKEDQYREVSSPDYSPQRRDKRWRRKRRLRVSDTVVTLVVALWAMRVPVLNVDVESLINDNQIPYIDFGHTTVVPAEMAKHMNRDVMLALCPARSPRPLYLFDACRQLVRVLTRHFGITIPEINYAPMAWTVISSVGGSPTTFAQVTRLLALLDVNLSLTDTSVELHTRKARTRGRYHVNGASFIRDETLAVIDYERTTRYQDVMLPELSVAAAWVMVMKMAYGLDGENRLALAKTDPAIGMPKAASWLKELQKHIDDGTLKGSRARLEKQDFSTMDPDNIDRYLDHCDSVLLRDQHTIPDANSFPLQPTNFQPESPPRNPWSSFHTSSAADTIAQSSLPPDIANKALPLMPGEKFRSYDADDITGTLPSDYEVVLNAAAQAIGVELVVIAGVIGLYERRMEKLRQGQGAQIRSQSKGKKY